MVRRCWRTAAWAMVVAGGLVTGCSLLGDRGAQEPQVAASRPASRPTTQEVIARYGLDPAKAFLTLEHVPPPVELPEPQEDPDRAIPPQAVKHYLAARDLFHRWINADAIAELEKALRYDPGSFECHLLLGRAAHRAGNLGQARNHLREAAKLRPDHVTCQYLLGVVALAQKDEDEAFKRLRLALKTTNALPERAETILTHFRLGEVLQKRGYLAAALRQFEAYAEATADLRGTFVKDRELLTLARGRPGLAALKIGQVALALRRYAQAAKAFERVLEHEPDNLKVRGRQIQALARAGRRDQALDLARTMALTEKTARAGVELLGWVYKDTGHPEKLADELRTLLSDHPDRGDLGVLLADALFTLDRKDEAERTLRRLIEHKPKLVAPYVRLAGLLCDRGDAPEAARVLADAIVAGPETHAGVLRAIAQLGSNTETGRLVVERADELLVSDRDNYALRYVVGLVAFYADRPKLAVQCLDQALEMKKDFAPAYLSLCQLHLRRFEWQRAIEVARRAEQAGQRSPAITFMLGQAYDGLDDVDRAVEVYQQAIKADPRSVPALVALGKLYERMGQKNKARLEYRRVLKIAPGNDEAGERLIRLLLIEGEADEAQKALKQFQRAGGSRLALGRCLTIMLSQRNIQKYRRLLEQMLEKQPKDAATRYDLASSFYATRDYERTSREVDRILEVEPGHHKARFLMAELCRKRLDYEGAAKVLKGMLREHPNRRVWLLALAEIHLDMQDPDRAATLYEGMLARTSDKARRAAYRLRLTGVYVGARQYDRAVAVLQAWLKEDPSSYTARQLLLEALHEAGKDARAVALARQWLAAGAGKPGTSDKTGKRTADDAKRQLRALLISAYVSAKQTDQALETLAGWMEADPTSRALMRQVWLVLYGAKRYDEAVEICQAGIAAASQPQTYRMMLAQSYLEADRCDDALSAVKQIPQSDRNEVLQRLEIMILLEAKRYDEAVRVATQAAARARNDQARMAMTRLLVLIHQRQGKMDLAEKELEKLLDKQPKDPGVNNDLGYTWADSGRHLARAERMVRYALGEESRNAAYMDSLGWVLYKKGDFAGAVHYLRKSTRAQGGDDPIIFDHLGDALWRWGKKDQAKHSWQQAIKLALEEQSEGKDPADPDTVPRVRQKLSQLESGGEPEVSAVAKPPARTQPATRAAVTSGPADP